MNILCRFGVLCLVVTAAGPVTLAADATDADADADVEFFEKNVRPLLVKHCYECHSKKADEVKGAVLRRWIERGAVDPRDGKKTVQPRRMDLRGVKILYCIGE